jgi:hypothetical protein
VLWRDTVVEKGFPFRWCSKHNLSCHWDAQGAVASPCLRTQQVGQTYSALWRACPCPLLVMSTDFLHSHQAATTGQPRCGCLHTRPYHRGRREGRGGGGQGGPWSCLLGGSVCFGCDPRPMMSKVGPSHCLLDIKSGNQPSNQLLLYQQHLRSPLLSLCVALCQLCDVKPPAHLT